ncbi:MAG TPA: hypothetical protein VLA55_08125 [Ornithinibacter sp.]|nr:hypothetical protein [Ornithinibacter sp.]
MPTADAISATHHAATHRAASHHAVTHRAASSHATHRAASQTTTFTSRREIADAGRVGIVMGWARGTLTVATGVVLTLIIARVAFGRSLIEALNVTGQTEPFSSEVAGFTAAVLPGMLVGWCLGFAAAATAVRTTWLGARVAGILAGAVGVAAGTALLLLSR